MRTFITLILGVVLSVCATIAGADDIKPGRPAGGGPETDPVATLLVSDGSGVTDVPAWWGVLAPGAALPALDGSALTNLPAGAPSPGPYDWADPYYEQAGDSLSAVLLADWPDASTVGGASSICRDQVLSRALRLRAATSSDCTTDYGSTDRAGGVLRSIGAGDFRVAFRVAIAPNSWPGWSGYAGAGVVFVDGADVAANSWYGTGAYYTAGGPGYTYSMYDDSTPPRWEGYGGGEFTIVWPAAQWAANQDIVLERTHAGDPAVYTLRLYIGVAHGILVMERAWTVSGGAGLVGLRTQTISTAGEVDITLLAYRAGLSEVP